MIEREISEPLRIDGVELPKHTLVLTVMMCLNFNEEVWENPHVSGGGLEPISSKLNKQKPSRKMQKVNSVMKSYLNTYFESTN